VVAKEGSSGGGGGGGGGHHNHHTAVAATSAAMTAAAMDAAFGVPADRRGKKRSVVVENDSDEEGSVSDPVSPEENVEGEGEGESVEPSGGYKSEVTFVAVGPKLRSGRRCKSVEVRGWSSSSGRRRSMKILTCQLRSLIPFVVYVMMMMMMMMMMIQINARVEPGDQQVTVSFELTPPDTSIGKFMVLCTTVGGKAIKSKKVGNPMAVVKGLTNGERYLFIVAVQDAARVRYDAPTTLSTIPGE